MSRNQSLVKNGPHSMDPRLRQSFEAAGRRFMFNLAQIEKKYCSGPNSGIVYGVDDDSVEFDENFCTAQNDQEMLNIVRREINHTDQSFGSCLLSTPAPDPENQDEKHVTRWKKLNQFYTKYLNESSRRETVKPTISRKRRSVEDTAVQRKRALLPITSMSKGSILMGPSTSSANANALVVVDPRKGSILHPNVLSPFDPARARPPSPCSGLVEEEESLRSGQVPDSICVIPPIQPVQANVGRNALPSCSTPKAICWTPTESPMTRLRKRCLMIEENYDKTMMNESIYGKVEDARDLSFIKRWLVDVKKRLKSMDYELKMFHSWQTVRDDK